MQNEVDACGKTPPSTPVVEEMVTKKAAAAAFIGQKLNQNVHFQKFNQNKGKFKFFRFFKGGFFSESAMCFSDLQISKKNIPKKLSLA